MFSVLLKVNFNAFYALCRYFIFILPVFYKFVQASRYFTLEMYFDICHPSYQSQLIAKMGLYCPLFHQAYGYSPYQHQDSVEPLVDVTGFTISFNDVNTARVYHL